MLLPPSPVFSVVGDGEGGGNGFGLAPPEGDGLEGCGAGWGEGGGADGLGPVEPGIAAQAALQRFASSVIVDVGGLVVISRPPTPVPTPLTTSASQQLE